MTVLTVAVALLLTSSPLASGATLLTITTSSLAPGEVGVNYVQPRLSASGGRAPYSFATASTLPAGLALSTNGTITGTPLATYDSAVVIICSDADGAVASAALALDVIAGPSPTTPTVPDPVVGVAYGTTLQATGGTPPYNWSVTSGPLPLGLVLNSSGSLSGIPARSGMTTTLMTVSDSLGSRVDFPLSITIDPSSTSPAAYFVTSAQGEVSAFAGPGVNVAQTGGGVGGVVGIATDATGTHYWLARANGRVVASPGTRNLGFVGAKRLAGAIVGIAALPAGNGYWLASSTGHVYGFGVARSLGSVPRRKLVGHIVGIAAMPTGKGYLLASSTGRVYAFGQAHLQPRQGRARLSPTVVGIAVDPTSGGYWLVTRAGRVYAFGRATAAGSIPAARHLRSIVGIAAVPVGDGYWLAANNGAVVPFGSAPALNGVEISTDPGAVAIASAP